MAKQPVSKNFHTLERVEIVWKNVNEIEPNNYNPNRQSDMDFELLCRSIEEDGFTQPILINKDTGKIVDGEHRWRACRILSQQPGKERFAMVPCVITDMTPEQAMISTLRHNRARGNEDLNRAAAVIQELDEMGVLQGAADSLMMDNVELDMFTTAIKGAELNLRTEGMTVAETEDTLARERELAELKAQEEMAMAKDDQNRYILQLTYLDREGYFVKTVIGRAQGKGILDIIRKAQQLGITST
jgi:ParB-like chromosome segregation protein Spo0J